MPMAASMASEAFLSASAFSSSKVGPAASAAFSAGASSAATASVEAVASAGAVASSGAAASSGAVASAGARSATSAAATAAASGAALPVSPAAASLTAASAAAISSAPGVSAALSAVVTSGAEDEDASMLAASAAPGSSVAGLASAPSAAAAGFSARGFGAGRAGKKPFRIRAASRMTRPENSVIVFIFCCLSAEPGDPGPGSTKQQGRARQPLSLPARRRRPRSNTAEEGLAGAEGTDNGPTQGRRAAEKRAGGRDLDATSRVAPKPALPPTSGRGPYDLSRSCIFLKSSFAFAVSA